MDAFYLMQTDTIRKREFFHILFLNRYILNTAESFVCANCR